MAKVNELFVYDNFSRTPVDEVQAGDICALTGIQDIMVGNCAQRRGRGGGLGADHGRGGGVPLGSGECWWRFVAEAFCQG